MADSPKARKVGDSVSVYDEKYGRWFPCKIVAISSLGGEIKMHWCGYKKSKDFWLERSSDRIGDLDKLPEVEVAGKRARDSDCEEDESCKRLRHTQKDGSPPPIENSAVDAAVESSDVRSAELLIDTLAKDLRVDSFHHPNVSDLLTEQDVSGSSPMMSPSGNSPGNPLLLRMYEWVTQRGTNRTVRCAPVLLRGEKFHATGARRVSIRELCAWECRKQQYRCCSPLTTGP